MVKGLVSNVRSRRKDGTGLVVALGRSIGVPDACEVVAALGAGPRIPRSLGALGVPGVRRSLRVLTFRRRREVRVCNFGNHTQMTTAAVCRVHGGGVALRPPAVSASSVSKPGLAASRTASARACRSSLLGFSASGSGVMRTTSQPGSRQTVTVHLTQVVAVRFGIRRKRTDDCRGVGVYIGGGGDRRLSAGRLRAAATTHVRHASGQILITGVAAPPSGETPCGEPVRGTFVHREQARGRWYSRPASATDHRDVRNSPEARAPAP